MLLNNKIQYVRDEKNIQLCQSSNMSQQIYDLSIEEYPLGIILPVRCNDKTNGYTNNLGGVITKHGEYVVSATIPGWVTGMYADYCCEHSSSVAVYCGRMIGQWGHFLLETITRLWFFLEYDNPKFIYVFIVREDTKPPVTGNFKQFFELLGINNRLVFLNVPTQYQKVIVPQRSFQYKRFYSYQYTNILDKIIQKVWKPSISTLKSNKVFLSRSRFVKARTTEVGLEMLDDYFVRNGYEVIHPECISLIDLIIKICSAKHCASESGSIAHNFLFCHSTQDTVIIERQTVINDAQTSIDRVRRLQTKYIDGHLTIFSIYTGEGPFFLCYTPCFENYTYDSGYKEPSMKYKSSTYLRKCLEDYLEMYKKIYKNNHPFIGNEERFYKSLNEAYWDTQHILETHGIEMKFKG